MKISNVKLIDDTIAFYVWKQKIQPCHQLIVKNVFVDCKFVLNRILEYEQMINKWRNTIFVESWRMQHENEEIQCTTWGQDNVETVRTSKWVVARLEETLPGELITVPVKYEDDPKSAEEYRKSYII
jgi:hypothetical protein